jgi:hypothetical protein
VRCWQAMAAMLFSLAEASLHARHMAEKEQKHNMQHTKSRWSMVMIRRFMRAIQTGSLVHLSLQAEHGYERADIVPG